MTLSRMNKTRIAAILLCSAALALPAMAQSDAPPPPPQDQTQPQPHGGPGGRRGGGGPEQRLAIMTKQLDLTPDQSAKVKAIFEDGRAQMQALRDDTSGDRREKMMGLMKTENEKIKAVLTAEQRTKFEEMEKRRRERMREGRLGDPRGQDGEGSAPPPPPPPPQS